MKAVLLLLKLKYLILLLFTLKKIYIYHIYYSCNILPSFSLFLLILISTIFPNATVLNLSLSINWLKDLIFVEISAQIGVSVSNSISAYSNAHMALGNFLRITYFSASL